MRYYLEKASASFLLCDVQKRTAIVGPSSSAVGQARFLAGTLGQIVEQVIVTDSVAEDRQGTAIDAIRSVAGEDVEVSFLTGVTDIAARLHAGTPELVLGSGLERGAAQEFDAVFVEVAPPLRGRPALRRSYAGIHGSVPCVRMIPKGRFPTRPRPASLKRICNEHIERAPLSGPGAQSRDLTGRGHLVQGWVHLGPDLGRQRGAGHARARHLPDRRGAATRVRRSNSRA